MEPLIELWQQARIEEQGTDRPYRTDDLVPRIIKLERSQQKLLRFKTLSSIILLLALLIVFINKMAFSLTGYLGIGIFVASVLSVVVILNRLRFRITSEERSLSTLQLAGVAERKLLTERRIFTFYLPLFIVVALTGFNLMYIEFFSELDSGTRILYHTVMTGSLVVAFVVGLSVRIRRFQKQFQPLLDRIRDFRKEGGS